MHDIIIGLYEDWLWLDERIEITTDEIEVLSNREAHCIRLKSVPGIGPCHYSDALSSEDGPASSYLDMFRHNVGAITAALGS